MPFPAPQIEHYLYTRAHSLVKSDPGRILKFVKFHAEAWSFRSPGLFLQPQRRAHRWPFWSHAEKRPSAWRDLLDLHSGMTFIVDIAKVFCG